MEQYRLRYHGGEPVGQRNGVSIQAVDHQNGQGERGERPVYAPDWEADGRRPPHEGVVAAPQVGPDVHRMIERDDTHERASRLRLRDEAREVRQVPAHERTVLVGGWRPIRPTD